MHLSSVEQRRIQFRVFAEVHVERHYVAFAQGVDGRVRNLSKSLLAVIPNRTWETRQEGRGSVIAHAPERFLAVFHERLEEHAELVFRPAEGCHQTVRFEGRVRGLVFRRDDRRHGPAVGRTQEAGNLIRPEKDSACRIGN